MEPWYSGMGAIVLAFVTVVSIALILLGVYGYKLSKETVHDYVLAGGTLGWVIFFFATAFTILSAWAFYGMAGWTYSNGIGIQMPWCLFINLCQCLLFSVIAPKMWALGKLYNYETPLQLICDRLNKPKLAPIFAGVNLIFLITYLALQPVAISLGLNILIGAPYEVGFFYGIILSTIVILLGGMRAVALSNVVLGIWFIIAFFGTLAISIISLPVSLVEATQIVHSQVPWVFSNPDPFGPLKLTGIERTGYALGYILSGFSGCLWIHLLFLPLTAKHPKVLLRYPSLECILFCLLYAVGGITMGTTLGHFFFPTSPSPQLPRPDQVVQALATNLGGVWWGSFVYVGAFCAAVSTIVTMQVAAGALFTIDIVGIFKKDIPEKRRLMMTRVFMIIFTIIAAYFGWIASYGYKSIGLPAPVPLSDFLNILASPGFALNIVLLLPLFWKRATWPASLISYLAGFIVLAIGYVYPPFMTMATGIRGMPALVLALPVEIILFLVICYLTKPLPPDILEKYFTKANAYLYRAMTESAVSNSQKKEQS